MNSKNRSFRCVSCGVVLGSRDQFCVNCGHRVNRCLQCGAVVDPQYAFCGNCGIRIMRCPQCGAPNISEATFCHKCGVALVSPPARITLAPSAKTSIERKAKLKAWLDSHYPVCPQCGKFLQGKDLGAVSCSSIICGWKGYINCPVCSSRMEYDPMYKALHCRNDFCGQIWRLCSLG